MSTSGGTRSSGAKSLTRVLIWTGVGLAGFAVLCAIAGLIINPIANHAPADDAPIVVADILLFAIAALAVMACAAVFAGLLLGAAVVGLWHHWRPAHGQRPEPLGPPPGGPAGPAEDSDPSAPRPGGRPHRERRVPDSDDDQRRITAAGNRAQVRQ